MIVKSIKRLIITQIAGLKAGEAETILEKLLFANLFYSHLNYNSLKDDVAIGIGENIKILIADVINENNEDNYALLEANDKILNVYFDLQQKYNSIKFEIIKEKSNIFFVYKNQTIVMEFENTDIKYGTIDKLLSNFKWIIDTTL